METGNEAAPRSLWSTFWGRLTSFLKNALCFTVDPEAAAVDALYAKIAGWNSTLLAFCFAFASQIAVLSLQTKSQLPPSFLWLSLFILMGFASLLVAQLAEFKILYCVGFFSLVFAFFIAIAISFPLYFMIISFAVFLATLALIIYFTIFPKTVSPSLPLFLSLSISKSNSLPSPPAYVTLSLVTDSMATEKLGIKIERNPPETKLDQLGVRKWPRWGCQPSKFPWTYEAKETCFLLEGKVKVIPAGSDESVEIGAGDLFEFLKGMSCT